MKLPLKPLSFAAGLVVTLATLSMAGTGSKEPLSPARVKEKVARLKADLTLTDAQATQIEQIMNEASVQAEAIRKTMPAEGAAADTQQSWDQMRQHHAQTKEKIRAVLTEEQRVKMDQLDKERRTRYKNKSKDGSH
jgi:Spy/CpxP family protein refolding chaperone